MRKGREIGEAHFLKKISPIQRFQFAVKIIERMIFVEPTMHILFIR